MKLFVGLRTKTYSYLKDNKDEDKEAEDTKKCIVKRKLKLKSYENCLKAAQTENKTNHLEKSKSGLHSPKFLRIHKK